MAAWFRVLGALTAAALVPVFFTATAFAEDPSPPTNFALRGSSSGRPSQ